MPATIGSQHGLLDVIWGVMMPSNLDQLDPRTYARRRVVIESVSPGVDFGRFPVKRVAGDPVIVQADIFADGHDEISARLLYRQKGQTEWAEAPMALDVNDRWQASFTPASLGRWQYTLVAWVDQFLTWQHDLEKRIDAEQDVSIDLEIGAAIVEEALSRASKPDAERLADFAQSLREQVDLPLTIHRALSAELRLLMERATDFDFATRYERELEVVVDRERAAFSSWYEMFPRSASPDPSRPGTFRDVEARLPYVAGMGFNVLYMPPIHPIGVTNRKGPNNSVICHAEDPGSPWAIGSGVGGHIAINPELGSLEDFQRLRLAALEHGVEIALDIAFQTSPDHPYAIEHPEWFRHRPDGSIQYAENPPKKYQDIYPFDFMSDDWSSLWDELRSVFQYWIDQGIRIFRVDNPHTKPFAFWEWVINSIKAEEPSVIFLAEAFTRPKVMQRLAKCGFSQSYTYFAWRNAKWELEQYLEELTTPPLSDYFRPNFWPNTPDILTDQLQFGGRPAFEARFILAATLSPNYGIYGPAFELQEHQALRPGSEEYLNSEKYQVRHWDLNRQGNLRPLITRINAIRQAHPALQRIGDLQFHHIENEQLIAYSKREGDDMILVVVNLDHNYIQSGWVDLPLERFDIDEGRPFLVNDLLTNAHYQWRGQYNYVELNPEVLPAHIFQIQATRRSSDFDVDGIGIG